MQKHLEVNYLRPMENILLAILITTFANSNEAWLNKSCLLHAATGNCTGFYRTYYYDRNVDDCLLFTYSGCNGNANRFPVKHDCLDTCKFAPSRNTADSYFHQWLHKIDRIGNEYFNRFVRESKLEQKDQA